MAQLRENPITGEILTLDKYDMTIRAYEMMTSEEIRMSAERDLEYRQMETRKQIKKIQKFNRGSKKSIKQDKRRATTGTD